MIMEQFQDALDYARENVMEVLAGGVIVLLLIGYLIFIATTLVPQLMLRTEMANQMAAAEAALAQRTGSQQGAPSALQAQVAAAEAELAAAAGVFLTEQEAAGFLNRLYQVADATNVVIQDLQAQSAPADLEKAAYDMRLFRLTAEADDVSNLTTFVGQIQETAVVGIMVQNVTITNGAAPALPTLTLELAIYTSPFASGNVLAQMPVAAGTAVPLPTQ